MIKDLKQHFQEKSEIFQKLLQIIEIFDNDINEFGTRTFNVSAISRKTEASESN
jgi:hypothetical protein